MITQDDVLDGPSSIEPRPVPEDTNYPSSHDFDTQPSLTVDSRTPHISLHALVGNKTIETFKIKSLSINNFKVAFNGK